VRYQGLTPDNFEEDREVVVEGRLGPAGVFQADTLMTRCESKYQAKVK
jgi:cytochrome c-type biogenesis protein CcmE